MPHCLVLHSSPLSLSLYGQTSSLCCPNARSPRYLSSLKRQPDICLVQRRWLARRIQACSVLEPPRASSDETAVVEAAWEILDNYNKNDINGADQPSLQSSDGLFALGASVLVAVEAALAQDGRQPLLGICASDAEQAMTVLQQWAAVLGCEFFMPQILDAEEDSRTKLGPVYLKFNPQSKGCYLQSYSGKFRGVIIQIGQKQVGHLPLFLFNQNPLGKDQPY